jgi:formylglycine-generating enzyme required for sulfatase activity
MIPVPGGSFSMGSTDEDDQAPVHVENVDPFDIDATEVTVGAYQACVDAHACAAAKTGAGCNWVDADNFCRAIRKRLPTEREWEYAARGKGGRKWPWGAAPPAGQLCWNGVGSDVGKGNRKSTCPVSSFPQDASGFGVLDLGGNVAEWTASRYCPYAEPNCASETRVIRGGAWDDFSAPASEATTRDKRSEFERAVRLGFRCARTP